MTESSRGTAVVTGAARGIGATFARHLVNRHDRLILVDRDADALAELTDQLAVRGPTAVELLTADLAETEGQQRAIDAVRGCEDLTLLVNNAGFSHPGRFAEIDLRVHETMFMVHGMATMQLCHAALPGMYAAGRGSIINMCAIAEALITPHNVMYGSSKAFVRAFSRILREDANPQGVYIQLLVPGYTRTSLHDTKAFENADIDKVPNWWWSTADRVVRDSLDAMERGKFICVPGRWTNYCMYQILKSQLIPRWVYTRWLI